jgi:CRISPR/Cas system-associated exonuclease Cas4 (RecB family)
MTNGETVTDMPKNCPRHVVFRLNDLVPKDIPEIYKKIGALHEDATWAQMDQGAFRREVALKQEVASGVWVSGRADFVGVDRIIETKGTAAKNAKSQIYTHGRYREDHLAQLLFYMIGFEKRIGELNYQIYKLNEEKTEITPLCARTFIVTIADNGEVFIDGATVPVANTQQLLDNLAQQVKVVTGELTPVPRPRDSLINWKPCNFCAFKIACQEYDSGNDGSIECLITLAKRYRNESP